MFRENESLKSELGEENGGGEEQRIILDKARDVSCTRYIIFLDIDGVLLPVPRFTFGGGELSPSCVALLQRIVEEAGGKDKVSIILSSTWRNFPEMVSRLNDFFAKETDGAVPCVAGGIPNGTVLVTEVSYYADDLSEQRLVRDRVDEIFRWLHTHILDYPEGIGGRWFAIDDMQLDVDKRMCGHFLKTETDIGLTEDSIEKARALMASLPSPESAVEYSKRALIDPALKDEEILILKIQRDRLQDVVNALEVSLTEVRAEVSSLSMLRRDLEKELKQQRARSENMSYRLAVAEFSKKNAILAAAVQYAATTSGPERKEIDERVKKLVTLLRAKKDLERKNKANMRRLQRVS